MNRKIWRRIEVDGRNGIVSVPSYIPLLQRLSMQRPDRLIMTFKVYNICMLGTRRNRDGIYNLRTRRVTEMGACSQVAPLTVSPIFL